MEKQRDHLPKLFTGIIFLIMLLIMISCKEEKKPVQVNSGKDLKQHVAAESDSNEKDLLGSSSPLVRACLFGITQSVYYIPGNNYDFK